MCVDRLPRTVRPPPGLTVQDAGAAGSRGCLAAAPVERAASAGLLETETYDGGSTALLTAAKAKPDKIDIALPSTSAMNLAIGPCNSEIPHSVDQLRSKAIAWSASMESAWKPSLKSSLPLRTSPNI